MKTTQNKNHVPTFLKLAVALMLITLIGTSCDKETPLTLSDEVAQKLTAQPWKISKVIVDGTEQTLLFKNLIITFSKTGFTTSGGGEVWPSSGNWNFVNDLAQAIKRSDGVEVSIVEVTDSSLQLKLTWTKNTFAPGREQSIAGVHTFTLTK